MIKGVFSERSSSQGLKKGRDQILIPVTGVTTAGIVVTTHCDSTTALAHGTYSIYLVLSAVFLPLISAARGCHVLS